MNQPTNPKMEEAGPTKEAAYLDSLRVGDRVIETGRNCYQWERGVVYKSENPEHGLCVRWDDGMGTSVTHGTRRISDVEYVLPKADALGGTPRCTHGIDLTRRLCLLCNPSEDLSELRLAIDRQVATYGAPKADARAVSVVSDEMVERAVEAFNAERSEAHRLGHRIARGEVELFRIGIERGLRAALEAYEKGRGE